jgi:hypothetical protein
MVAEAESVVDKKLLHVRSSPEYTRKTQNLLDVGITLRIPDISLPHPAIQGAHYDHCGP